MLWCFRVPALVIRRRGLRTGSTRTIATEHFLMSRKRSDCFELGMLMASRWEITIMTVLRTYSLRIGAKTRSIATTAMGLSRTSRRKRDCLARIRGLGLAALFLITTGMGIWTS